MLGRAIHARADAAPIIGTTVICSETELCVIGHCRITIVKSGPEVKSTMLQSRRMPRAVQPWLLKKHQLCSARLSVERAVWSPWMVFVRSACSCKKDRSQFAICDR